MTCFKESRKAWIASSDMSDSRRQLGKNYMYYYLLPLYSEDLKILEKLTAKYSGFKVTHLGDLEKPGRLLNTLGPK